MPTRQCPTCRGVYKDSDTNCTRCQDTPAALAPGTVLSAQLMLAETTPTGLKTLSRLGTAQYTIERVLGWGGMATAYVVKDFGGVKVVKEIRPNSNTKVMDKMIKLFLREQMVQCSVTQIMVQKPLAFPGLPKGYGNFQAYGRLYMAMDFMEGRDWDRIQDQSTAPLPLLDVLQMGMEVCIILHNYLHGYLENGQPFPLIHRDIKPANIQRLSSTNTSCLLDYGIARPQELSQLTMARGGTRAGSESFAPPEFNVKGVKPTQAFDTYCLCSSMWSLLVKAKELPGTRDMLVRSIRNIPNPKLQQILIRGTEDDPTLRFQTAEELRRALEQIYTTQKTLPRHLGGPAAVVKATRQFVPTAPPRSITLPTKQKVSLRDGEEITIAREDTQHPVTVRVKDPTVSSTPVKLFAHGGELYVTGGGSTGFAIVTTVKHRANQPITLPSVTAHKITFMLESPDPKLPPVTLSSSGGNLRASSGGGAEISVVLTTRYRATESIKVPRTGKVVITIGKDTKLPVE